jgi:Pin2-interacting protein X1
LKKVSKPKKRKLKDATAAEAEGERDNGPSFEELFAATGGARLGMRARGSQQGKLQRTEGAPAACEGEEPGRKSVAEEAGEGKGGELAVVAGEEEERKGEEKKKKKDRKEKKKRRKE